MKRTVLNERDARLLQLLRDNARESVSSLARKLGVSRTAVQERILRLQREGVIRGFTVQLNPDWLKGQINAMVSLVVDPKFTAKVIDALETMPAIAALWTVSGKNDLIAMARAPTTADIDRVLDEVGSLQGVTRTESSIILTTRFDRR
ncbi:MAG: Lrp/AsnC family transcriptional regulator [Gammaproteobacteria bacterium]|nr:Lrp/AsnC family transcriptional regulator [Gammaproteobacteria bacterium]